MKPVYKLIAEVPLTILGLLLLWSAVGRLMSGSSDLQVLAGVLLLIITLFLLVLAARTIFYHVKEMLDNVRKNR